MVRVAQHRLKEKLKEMSSLARAWQSLFDSTLALLFRCKHPGLWRCARPGCRGGRSREARTPAMRAKPDCSQVQGPVMQGGVRESHARRLHALTLPVGCRGGPAIG